MHLEHVTFTGPTIDDAELLAKLPGSLAGLLKQLNGFIQFHGGFHLRGACSSPAWHSLADAWFGESAYHRLYPAVTPDDIPFAQDCLGDQFLLRGERVWRLAGETGEVEPLDLTFGAFLAAVNDDPVEFLSLQPLLQFQQEGSTLPPGQLLAAYPPFCTTQAADGVHLAAVSAEERRLFLADFARQIRDIPDGGTFDVAVVH